MLEVLKIKRKRNFVSLPDLNQPGGRKKELLYIQLHIVEKRELSQKGRGWGETCFMSFYFMLLYI